MRNRLIRVQCPACHRTFGTRMHGLPLREWHQRPIVCTCQHAFRPAHNIVDPELRVTMVGSVYVAPVGTGEVSLVDDRSGGLALRR